LEQLAALAPETFTRKIIDHLLPAVTSEYLPYSIPAARALLGAELKKDERLGVAVRLIDSFANFLEAINCILLEADEITKENLEIVVPNFVSMAVPPPPGIFFGGDEPREYNAYPIKTLYKKRPDDLCEHIDSLLNSLEPSHIGAASKTLLAIEDVNLFSKYARSILGKLMRRRTLLPKERRESSVVHYLRETASKCFEHSPTATDAIIQSYLDDNDELGRKEAFRLYRRAIKIGFREKVTIGEAQHTAFKRLLWAAVDKPDEHMDEAGQFFRNAWDELAELAERNFDDLIGAAATLSEKYKAVDQEPTIEIAHHTLFQMDQNNKRSAIDSLQGALMEWAAIGARSRGEEGIEDFLDLYRKLPEDQTQMRGNMIVHVSKLVTGVSSLNAVLSDWYRALMDESTLVRASAVQAWKDVPHRLREDFPDLFFEAFAALLTDPYVMVHRSVVRTLDRRSFPEHKRHLLYHGLSNLILHYANENKRQDFVVDCIGVFASLCLSEEQRTGKIGKYLCEILLTLEESALYHAVDRLDYRFSDTPDFLKVAIKSLKSDYTRSISIDDSMSSILRASSAEVQKCTREIEEAFKALQPLQPEDFIEALFLISTLTRADSYNAALRCIKIILDDIPEQDRHLHRKIRSELVHTACKIEECLAENKNWLALAEHWRDLVEDLKKDDEERTELRHFPPSLLS